MIKNFLKIIIYLHFMYLNALLTPMYIFDVCAWYTQRPEESIRSLEIGVTNMDAENRTQVLYNRVMCSQTLICLFILKI